MVENVNGVQGAGGGMQARKLNKVYSFDAVERGTDRVELSNDVMTVRGLDKARMEKIMDIRRQIAEGTYVTPEKLNISLDRALDDALDR